MKKHIKDFLKWSVTFTRKVITLVTVLWFFERVFSASMILYAVKVQENFSYLDTFITDSGETFRMIVGAYLITKTVENVFKYNEGGFFGKSVKVEENEAKG